MTHTQANFTAVPDATRGGTQHTTLRAVGGPTAVLDVGNSRIVTDPTFDKPGAYSVGSRQLFKTEGPAWDVEELGPIDAVLLSHDQHPDNLDVAGRALVQRTSTVLTTPAGAERLGGTAVGLRTWESVELRLRDGRVLTVLGVPALHGPAGTQHLTGDVTGFVLSGDDIPTIYVSGDNASLDVVADIRQRIGQVDVAVLHAGGAKTALLGDAYLTLTSEGAAEASRILGATKVVVLHTDGWSHFTQGASSLPGAFVSAGLRDRLVALAPGQSTSL